MAVAYGDLNEDTSLALLIRQGIPNLLPQDSFELRHNLSKISILENHLLSLEVIRMENASRRRNSLANCVARMSTAASVIRQKRS